MESTASHYSSFSISIHPRGKNISVTNYYSIKTQNDSWYRLRDTNLRSSHLITVAGVLCSKSTLYSFFYQSSYIPIKHYKLLTCLGRSQCCHSQIWTKPLLRVYSCIVSATSIFCLSFCLLLVYVTVLQAMHLTIFNTCSALKVA